MRINQLHDAADDPHRHQPEPHPHHLPADQARRPHRQRLPQPHPPERPPPRPPRPRDPPHLPEHRLRRPRPHQARQALHLLRLRGRHLARHQRLTVRRTRRRNRLHHPRPLTVDCPRPHPRPADRRRTRRLTARHDRMNHMTELPNRFTATPAEVDAYLRTILAEDTYLKFQQTIGEHALGEVVEDAQTVRASADNDGLYNADWREGWDDFRDRVDPDRNDPYPVKLIEFPTA